jgi:preprotein translocase subunit YajC
MTGVIFLVVMLLIAWLLVIMPQQRRVRAHQAVVNDLHEGDEVMTTSGILGRINSIDGDLLRLEVAPGIELRVVKGAIARRTPPEHSGDHLDEAAGAETQAAPATEE